MPEMVYGCRSKLRNFGQVALDRGLGTRFKNESMFFYLAYRPMKYKGINIALSSWAGLPIEAINACIE